MADYYPLIARAIASLGPDSTSEDRRQMYDRASAALIGQLRSIDPPLSDDDVERERMSLNEAIARVEAEIVGSPGEASGTQPLVPAGPEVVPFPQAEPAAFEPEPEPEPPPAPEPLLPRHPQAPRPEVTDRSWIRGAVVAGGIAVVVAITGYVAWRLRDKPSDFQQPVVAQEQQQKYTDRLGEGGAPPAPAPPTPAEQQPAPAPAPPARIPVPSQIPTLAQQPPPVIAGQAPGQPLTVMQRAILVEEPEQGQQARGSAGTVTWKLDTVPGGDGGVVDNAVHASIDLPDSGLKGEIIMRKNRDPALPASHTIEARFQTSEKSVNGKIRDMTVPEMRVEDGQRGVPLMGLPVPVMENLVLVGLSNLPQDVERNLDLLKTRNWLAFLVRYTNGKRALLIFEKGAPGDAVLQDALKAWQQ